MDHNTTLTKIVAATITSTAISISDVESTLRIVSMLVGITLSILAYRQNKRNREK